MKIFVVNCGSSSIKYQLFSMTNEKVLAKGLVERVGTNDARIKFESADSSAEHRLDAPDHTAAMKHILEALVDPRYGVLENIDEIEAVGHRVLHGGEKIHESMLIDDRVKSIIREYFQLGPLHNPANLMGIEASMKAMPGKPNVAVFDTAFFATMPPKAFRYAVPNEWYERYHVRKYGFHGTSHRFVTGQASIDLGKSLDQLNIISVHLGNGCSVTATHNGKAVDHSMGLTPLEGLMMGTRSGDLDPAVMPYMMKQANLSGADIDRILNKESGLLGVSGTSNDMRDLLKRSEAGDVHAATAIEMFVYRIIKYIGAYFTIMPACDALIFTGGIGENSVIIRRMVCEGLKNIGVKFDEKRNEQIVGGKKGTITENHSPLPVWVIPTNEELVIARDTRRIVAG